MVNGDTTSIYWSNDNQFDTSIATITRMVESPALKYQIDSGFDVPGMLVDQDFTKLSILQRPEIIIGKMDAKTQLIIQTKKLNDIENLLGQIAYASGGEIFIHDLAKKSDTRITFSQNNHNPDWSYDGQYLLYIHGTAEKANLIVLDSNWNEISTLPARAGRWGSDTHNFFWITQNHDRFIRTDFNGNNPTEVFDINLIPNTTRWDDFTVGTHDGVIVSRQSERGLKTEGYFRQLYKGWESYWETYQAPEYQGHIPEMCMFALEESRTTGDWAFVINTDCMGFPGWNTDIIFASGCYLENAGRDPAWSPDGKYLTYRYMERCNGPGMCYGGIAITDINTEEMISIVNDPDACQPSWRS